MPAKTRSTPVNSSASMTRDRTDAERRLDESGSFSNGAVTR